MFFSIQAIKNRGTELRICTTVQCRKKRRLVLFDERQTFTTQVRYHWRLEQVVRLIIYIHTYLYNPHKHTYICHTYQPDILNGLKTIPHKHAN